MIRTDKLPLSNDWAKYMGIRHDVTWQCSDAEDVSRHLSSLHEPQTKRTFYTFISNSEEHDKAGEHWNAWVVSGSTVTFFDSFSRDPRHKHFPRHYTEFIKKFDKVNFVSKRVQSTKSTYCGLFCMHFIYIMSLGLDVNSFLEDYSSNYDKNDDAVVGITQGFFF